MVGVKSEVNGVRGTAESIPTNCVHFIDLVGARLEDSRVLNYTDRPI